MHGLSPASVIPARAGIGLKARHIPQVLADKPDVGWFELHAENGMGAAGGPLHRQLERVRAHYPLSIHGDSLSLGRAGPLGFYPLERLARVMAVTEPESPSGKENFSRWRKSTSIVVRGRPRTRDPPPGRPQDHNMSSNY